MTTDPQEPIVPPGQTQGGNEPDEPVTESSVHGSAGDDADATTTGAANPPDGQDDEPSISDAKKADAAMDPMQAVHDYAETKRA